jgi:hypothetical protein
MIFQKSTSSDPVKNRLQPAAANGVNSETKVLEAAMTLISRAIPVFAAAAVLAASAVPASAPAFAKSNYDGHWSVLIVTQKGTCDRAYRYPVKIDNGAVGYAGSASFNVSGKVGANGAVTVIVSHGDKSATGTGRMSTTDGSGIWTAASGECSGTWTAERRSS